MKVGALFSGGKDSCLALYHALKKHQVMCLITLISENPDSYMFHTLNINWAKTQAQAIGLPIIIQKTKGEKEKELKDLERAIKKAKDRFGIKGIVSGAVASIYQQSRIKKICSRLKLKAINPLWQKNQFGLLDEVVKLGFDVVITGVFAEGLENLLGKKIDENFIAEIKKVHEKYQINPIGEGGEFETFVLWAPFFKKHLKIEKSKVEGSGFSKILVIDKLT